MDARRLARVAGALYMLNILFGAYAIGVVPSLTHDGQTPLGRSGVAAHLVTVLTNVPLAILFYELFKVVHRRLAMLVAAFTLTGTAIEAASLTVPAVPGVAPYDVYTAFFGCNALALGYLVYRSTFLPRAIGALLILDGVTYLLFAAADILSPAFATHLVPWTQLPILLAEGGLTLWLLVFGLDLNRWRLAAGRVADDLHKEEDQRQSVDAGGHRSSLRYR